jgi:penicillin-binding protein 1C
VTLALIFVLSLPDPLFRNYYSPVLYDRKGELLGATVALDGQWRFPPAPGINEKFTAAITEYEDRRFRRHPGVDPAAIVRAFIRNAEARRVVSGGSTLTMQTVRIMRGRTRRTLFEKALEAVLALRLEISCSKDEILALYAANAPFGGNVVGLEAAAWRWFGRSQAELSWAEAAALAVLPNEPGLVHPGRNRDILEAKRNSLLDRLFARGVLDGETLVLAKAEPLPEEPKPLPRFAPHLLARIIRERGGAAAFRGDQSGGTAGGPGARIETSLDRAIQERAQVIMNRWAGRFFGNGIMNGACLIMDTRTGEVAASVGNPDTPVAADVDLVTARRSSGSILKPFLYAAMLDGGYILPGSLVSDIPTRVGSYSPENITRNYLGALPAAAALARSLNIPAVRSLRVFGVDRFARLLRSMGVTTLFRKGEDYGLPLILGGAEVTLWEMAGLYGGLARTALAPEKAGSSFFPPRVFAGEGKRDSPPGTRPLSPGAAWLTLEALTFVVRPGEESAWQDYAGSRRIAWKTGTSFGFRDAWAVGVTPRWTVAVWIGNATGEGRAELRSAVTSAPVLFELFSALEPGEWFPRPAGDLTRLEVCANSGFPAGPDCETLAFSEVPRNTPAQASCPYCRTVTLNLRGDRRVLLEGGSPEPVIQKKWFVLPPAEEWYLRKWNLDYKPLPPLEGIPEASAPMALFNPEARSQVYVPTEIDGRPGRIVFTAAHREPEGVIHWHLDHEYLGATRVFHEVETRPSPGFHTLTLVDNAGNSLSRSFEALDKPGE